MYLYVMFPISNTEKFVSEMYEPSTEKTLLLTLVSNFGKLKKISEMTALVTETMYDPLLYC